MPKQAANNMKTDIFTDQFAGIGVAQVMDAGALDPGGFTHTAPEPLNLLQWLTGSIAWKQVGTIWIGLSQYA